MPQYDLFHNQVKMDKLEKYRQIIVNIVKKHAQYKPSHGKIEALCICDQESDNYLLIKIL